MTAWPELNDTEREYLLLLQRGHTAKTIAASKGVTEAAVNERFRSARRKTGVGSSRELARRLNPLQDLGPLQENRDEVFGLAESHPSPALLKTADARRRASLIQRWSFPMAAAVLLAAAILAQQTSVPLPSSDDRTVEIASAAFAENTPSPDLSALHAEVNTGQPDPTWSPTTEAVLSKIYNDIPAVGAAIGTVNVTCNASLCEVLGVSRPGPPATEASTLPEAMPVQDLFKVATRLKLRLVAQSINSNSEASSSADPTATVLVAYWRRADN